jgi:hydrogenase/urease accessory protein HupE
MIGPMLLTPWLLAVTLALIAVTAIPTRRLFRAGVGRGVLTTYLLALVAIGLLAASGRGPDRLLVPCFVVAFAAPLVASPDLIRRILRRAGRRRGLAPPRDPP